MAFEHATTAFKQARMAFEQAETAFQQAPKMAGAPKKAKQAPQQPCTSRGPHTPARPLRRAPQDPSARRTKPKRELPVQSKRRLGSPGLPHVSRPRPWITGG